jgi:hypothetical protein
MAGYMIAEEMAYGPSVMGLGHSVRSTDMRMQLVSWTCCTLARGSVALHACTRRELFACLLSLRPLFSSRDTIAHVCRSAPIVHAHTTNALQAHRLQVIAIWPASLHQ